jgi:hypothetical protein
MKDNRPPHTSGSAARAIGISESRVRQLDRELGTTRDQTGRRLVPADAVDRMAAERRAFNLARERAAADGKPMPTRSPRGRAWAVALAEAYGSSKNRGRRAR